MYSGSVKYRVYKKDIEHYRIEVFDINTKEWKEVGNDYPINLTLFNCKLVVDDELRVKCISGKLDGADVAVVILFFAIAGVFALYLSTELWKARNT